MVGKGVFPLLTRPSVTPRAREFAADKGDVLLRLLDDKKPSKGITWGKSKDAPAAAPAEDTGKAPARKLGLFRKDKDVTSDKKLTLRGRRSSKGKADGADPAAKPSSPEREDVLTDESGDE